MAEVGEKVLESGHVLFGVGVVENAYDEPAIVEAIPPQDIPGARPSFSRSTWR
jgi:hypothetical protein